MKLKFVDLYEYFGKTRPESGAGTLKCYLQNTPDKLSPLLRPAVLVIPGGGYGHISQREGEPVALRFLARGYNAFVLDYSVAPLRFPTALQEAAMAMAYIRSNAGELEINPNLVAAIGFSAGGHLCGTLGMLYDGPEVSGIGSPAQVRPDALGLCYPVAVSWGPTHAGSFENLCGEDDCLRQRLSLDKMVRPDMPPVYLWHTRDDEAVPCRNSLVLANALADAGVDMALRLYRHGRHGLSTADDQTNPAWELPELSPDISRWPEEMMVFFREVGFKSRKMEENA